MELVYRALLLAYPRAFRREYGAAMIELLRHQRDSAHRRTQRFGVIAFWAFAFDDLARNAFAERTRSWRGTSVSGLQRHNPTSNRPPLPAAPPRGLRETMINLLQELRHAARRLAKTPVFALTAVAIVALGIGANTAIFSFVDGVLLRPQPYERPEEIVDIYQDSDEGRPTSTSFPAYRDIRARTDVLSEAVAVMSFGVSLLEGDEATSMTTEWVTSNYFSMLGLSPHMGRDFEPADEIDGGEPVAILGYSAWQTRFGADPDILGRRLNLNGSPVTVVGIAPRNYNGIVPGFNRDLWLSLSGLRPLFGDYVGDTIDSRANHWFLVKARLAPGVNAVQAQAAMTALADRLAEEFPQYNKGRRITVFAPGEIRLHPNDDANMMSMSIGLLTVVGLVLLIACSNLANLLLLRNASRSRDVSVRLALGASRAQIFVHVLSESVLLSVAGGAVGLAVAGWSVGAFMAAELPFGFPAPADLRIDPRIMLFTTGLTLATGIVFGIIPALRLSRSEVVSSIREDVAPLTFRSGRLSLRNALVAGQVALSFVLLVIAGLFIRSLGNAQRADLGFQPDGLAAIGADLGYSGYDSTEANTAFEEFRQRVENLPGVDSAALADQLPLSGSRGSSTLIVDGYVDADGTEAVEVSRAGAGPGYFRTVGTPLLYGRTFEPGDDSDSASVSVISEAMARAYWGKPDAVGGRFRGQGGDADSWIEVVGVVGDAKVQSATEAPRPVFYYSTAQSLDTAAVVVARTSGDPAALLVPMRQQLRVIEPTVPILRLTTLDDHLSGALAVDRFTARLLSGFGVLGLVLAALGIYAVVGFAVQRRTAELGIRMALGAVKGQVVRMVIGEVMVIVAVALVVGLGGAMLVGPSVASVLFGVSPTDPVTLMATAALLALTAALATWLPARRAAGVDPVKALRSE